MSENSLLTPLSLTGDFAGHCPSPVGHLLAPLSPGAPHLAPGDQESWAGVAPCLSPCLHLPKGGGPPVLHAHQAAWPSVT